MYSRSSVFFILDLKPISIYNTHACERLREEVVSNGNPLRHRQNVQPPQRKAADQKDKTQKITIHITILFIYVCMDNILVVVIHPSIHTWVDALCFTLAPLHRSSSASMHSSYCSLRCAFEWLKTLVGLLCDRYSSPTLFLSFISITCSKAKVFLITSFKRQALRLLDIWIL